MFPRGLVNRRLIGLGREGSLDLSSRWKGDKITPHQMLFCRLLLNSGVYHGLLIVAPKTGGKMTLKQDSLS